MRSRKKIKEDEKWRWSGVYETAKEEEEKGKQEEERGNKKKLRDGEVEGSERRRKWGKIAKGKRKEGDFRNKFL